MLVSRCTRRAKHTEIRDESKVQIRSTLRSLVDFLSLSLSLALVVLDAFLRETARKHIERVRCRCPSPDG